MKILDKIFCYYKFTRPLAALIVFFLFFIHAITAIYSTNSTYYNIKNIFTGAITFSLLTLAAYALNNISDLETDKINKPFRVLPSGEITKKEAMYIALLGYFVSIIFLLILPFPCSILFFLTIVITIFYSVSPLALKKHWISSSIAIGITRGFLLVIASWSIVTTDNFRLMFLFLLFHLSTYLEPQTSKIFLIFVVI